jgi:putative addiction module killer protein
MKTVLKHENFTKWFVSLKDRQIKLRIQVRIDRAEIGNYGDCESVGEGVLELRMTFGSGYRVYFIERGLEIIVLLAGGDKSTQSNDIKKAIELSKEV